MMEHNEKTTTTIPGNRESSQRFKTLSGLSSFISFMGFLLITLAILSVIGALQAIDSNEELIGLAIMGGGVIILVLGILIVAQGQSISCFIAIERNTRITANQLGES